MQIDIPDIPFVENLRLCCAEPGSWRFETSCETAQDGAALLRLRLAAPAPAVPPRFDLLFGAPQPGVRWIWNSRDDVPALDPDWLGGASMQTEIARGTPVLALAGCDDRARLTIACSEASRLVDWNCGIREADGFAHVRMTFFSVPEAPIDAWEATVRLDPATAFWADAVRAASDWVCSRPDYAPMPVPDAAREPLYSTWYGFHQDVIAADIEAECAKAADCGMKVVILDDGWMRDGEGALYAYCGDWKPAPRRFPDGMAAHVARVRALGLRYMMWFSVPFVGEKSEVFERFRGKFLSRRERIGAWILDPRFPEVRDYLAGTYERAVREWGLDGLKLDFIDNFVAPDPDPAVAEDYAGRDIRAVPEAVHALMTEVRRRLVAAKPDILIEFRQTYMGPAIRSFGNMIRAGDVPGDLLRNRARTARLRLTSGDTAVHSDMLEWNPHESPEQAAQQILSVLFSVIQYSMRLDRLPEEQLRMVRHWIRWTTAHREALLLGAFRPHAPERGYPLLEGATAAERVAAVYAQDLALRGGPADRELWIVNATDAPEVLLDLAAAPASAEAFDTFGAPAPVGAVPTGLSRAAVPVSGLLHLRW